MRDACIWSITHARRMYTVAVPGGGVHGEGAARAQAPGPGDRADFTEASDADVGCWCFRGWRGTAGGADGGGGWPRSAELPVRAVRRARLGRDAGQWDQQGRRVRGVVY